MKNKKRKIDRKHLIHTFVFALFCVFGLTVAYAALSTTLNISGNAQVASSEWSLTVTEDDTSSWGNSIFSSKGKVINGNAVTFGDGAVIKKPTISGTTLNGFEFSLTKPGDDVALYYKITNTGTIPAVFKTYSFSDFTIVSSVGNNNDVIWGQDNVLLEFDIAAPNDKGQMSPIFTDYVVCPGQYVVVVVASKIFEDTNTIPTAAVTFSNIRGEIVFEQGNLNSCPA